MYSFIKLTGSWVLMLGAIIAMVLPVDQVRANGFHLRNLEVFSGPSEPYYFRVLTAPVIGIMHMRIFVSEFDSGDPVTGAGVQVSGRVSEDGSQTVGRVSATASSSGLNWYEVNLPIEEPGQWVFTLTVEGSLGEATVAFPVKIQQSGDVNWGIMGMVTVVLSIAVGLALLRRQGNRS